MKLTFSDVAWRNGDDSDVFNIHAIKSIELDTTHNIVTIIGASGTYKSPYCNFHYGGGVTHYEFTTVRPYCYNTEYINIAVFDNTSKVCVAAGPPNVPEWFAIRCKQFCI